MSVAMMLGMMLLAPVATFLWPGSAAVFEIHLAVMATNMVIGMSVPMLLRRHSLRSIVEMSAVMYLAFLVVLVPYWLGLAGTGFVMLWGHVLMFVAMLVVMLLRPHKHEVAS
jgi:flagellar biosynthetic protein FliP